MSWATFLLLTILTFGTNTDPSVSLITTQYDETAQKITITWEYQGDTADTHFSIYRAAEPFTDADQLTQDTLLATQPASDPFEYIDTEVLPGPLYYSISITQAGTTYQNVQMDQSTTEDSVLCTARLPIAGLTAEFSQVGQEVVLHWRFNGVQVQRDMKVKVYRCESQPIETWNQIDSSVAYVGDHTSDEVVFLGTTDISDAEYGDPNARRGTSYYYAVIPYWDRIGKNFPEITLNSNSMPDPIDTGIAEISLLPYQYINDLIPPSPPDETGIGPPELLKPDTPLTRWGIFTRFDSLVVPKYEQIVVETPVIVVRAEGDNVDREDGSEIDRLQNLDYQLRLAITRVYYMEKDYERALSLFSRYYYQLSEGYNKTLAILYLARSLYHLGEYDRALFYLDEVKASAHYESMKTITDLFYACCQEMIVTTQN